MHSIKTSTSQGISDDLLANRRCVRCGGLLRDGVIYDDEGIKHNERKCLSCGRQVPLEVKPPTSLLSDITASQPPRKKKIHPSLRMVSIPDLTPPVAPHDKEDSDGTYEVQLRTYIGYEHFKLQAETYKNRFGNCRTKRTKLINNYRARLCTMLACTLGKIYLRQTPEVLCEQFEKQHLLGHAVKEGDRTVARLYKTYSSLMLQAMTHLKQDPIVQEWKRKRVALGNKEYLRRARKGIEKGVRPPYRSGQEALADLTIIELGRKGHTAGEIRTALSDSDDDLPARSREGIRKRLKTTKTRSTFLKYLDPRLPK